MLKKNSIVEEVIPKREGNKLKPNVIHKVQNWKRELTIIEKDKEIIKEKKEIKENQIRLANGLNGNLFKLR